eukprot:SM000076S21759  [mRNA]  locus=s76:94257:95203:+ [translate_table: standard]
MAARVGSRGGDDGHDATARGVLRALARAGEDAAAPAVAGLLLAERLGPADAGAETAMAASFPLIRLAVLTLLQLSLARQPMRLLTWPRQSLLPLPLEWTAAPTSRRASSTPLRRFFCSVGRSPWHPTFSVAVIVPKWREELIQVTSIHPSKPVGSLSADPLDLLGAFFLAAPPAVALETLLPFLASQNGTICRRAERQASSALASLSMAFS